MCFDSFRILLIQGILSLLKVYGKQSLNTRLLTSEGDLQDSSLDVLDLDHV